MKRTYLIAALGVLLFAGSALAGTIVPSGLTYTFSASPDTLVSGNLIEPFTFSFQTPTFLGPGDPFTFDPFTITDGTSTWTITSEGSTYLDTEGGCFLFGSGDQTLANGPNTLCSLGYPTPGNADMWFFQGPPQANTFPTSDGTYSGYYAEIYTNDDPGDSRDFDATLTVSGASSAAPEPSSVLLFGTGLIGLVIKSRRSLVR